MTAAPPGPSLFSSFSGELNTDNRIRRETFLLSLLGQALILGLIVYLTSCVIENAPEISRQFPNWLNCPSSFSGITAEAGAIAIRCRHRKVRHRERRSMLKSCLLQ